MMRDIMPTSLTSLIRMQSEVWLLLLWLASARHQAHAFRSREMTHCRQYIWTLSHCLADCLAQIMVCPSYTAV